MCLVSVKRAKVRAPHFPALIDEFVPGKAAVIGDIVDHCCFAWNIISKCCTTEAF